jgi:glyoxylase-like metal-dependent hydrolase (beta-lactamase superfamily II)
VGIHQEDADFVSGKKTMPTPKGAMNIVFKIMSPFFKFRPVEPDITLKENDKIDGLVVIHTPGHTPGSISLYDSLRRVLFVGDAIRFVDGKIE